MNTDSNFQSFIAAQTVLIQQMHKEYTADESKNNACLQLIGESLTKLKEQVELQASALQTNQVAGSITEGNNTLLTQNIPWPQPLDVENGDIYENFQFF